MTRLVCSFHRYLLAATVAAAVLFTPACAPAAEVDDTNPVAFNAAFTPLGSVTIYDAQGRLVETLGTGEVRTDLADGRYYVDFRDDQGQSAISEDNRLLFAPLVVGGELDMTIYRFPRRGTAVLALNVGEAPAFTSEALATSTQPLSAPAKSVQAVTNAPPGFSSEASARARLVWEAARAMKGPYSASSYVWNATATEVSRYNYVGEDAGAWWNLRNGSSVTDKDGTFHLGWNVSCRDADSNWQYDDCYTKVGQGDARAYGLQDGIARGGQCKPFSALIAYRSGIYHGANWSFKALPSDRDTSVYPKVTKGALISGDILRRVGGHSVIVVRVLAADKVVVIDSNWVNGGDGYESIGTHVMSFDGDYNKNLGNYYNYRCVYTASGC